MENKEEMEKIEQVETYLINIKNSTIRLAELVKIEEGLTRLKIKNSPGFFMSKPKQSEFLALSESILIDSHLLNGAIRHNGNKSTIKAKL